MAMRMRSSCSECWGTPSTRVWGPIWKVCAAHGEENPRGPQPSQGAAKGPLIITSLSGPRSVWPPAIPSLEIPTHPGPHRPAEGSGHLAWDPTPGLGA